MNICIRYTKTEADAMEALNTGFYKVFMNIENYDSQKSTLYTWIRTIIINSCIDRIRKNENLSFQKPIDDSAGRIADPSATDTAGYHQLLHYVRNLPPASRTVFNLYIMEGYSHKEIASMLSISENTSKWHVSEARKKLQQLYMHSNT